MDIYIFIYVNTVSNVGGDNNLIRNYQMELSYNGDTPTSSMLSGFYTMYYPLWGTHINGNLQIRLDFGIVLPSIKIYSTNLNNYPELPMKCLTMVF